MSDPAPAWETSKENVLPIKRGRSAKGLSDVLSKSTIHQEVELANREREFDTQLRACDLSQPALMLDVYVQYIKWAKDAFPTSPTKIHQLLERCTVDLKDCEDLKNDARLVTLWIEYADLVRTPGEIFSYMAANKVGERLALFWIAWAYVAEKAQNYKLTDQIFQKGTRRLAEPKETLSKRYKQFQRRMARQFLNGESVDGSETASSVSGSAIDDEVTARAMNAIRSAPTAAPAGPAASTTSAAAGAPKRRALSAIEDSGAGGVATAAPAAIAQPSAVRPSSHSHGHPPAAPVAAAASVSGRARPSAPAAQSRPAPAGKGASNQGASFEIFSDFSAPTGASAPPVTTTTARGAAIAAVAPHLYEAHLDDVDERTQQQQFPATWGNLGTEATRRKENDGPVTKWTQGPLPGAAGVPTSAALSSAPSIPIFVDPEFAVGATEAEETTAPTHDLSNVLSVRRKLDPMESMARNPLARHTATAAPAAAVPSDAPAARTAPSKPLEAAAPVPAKLSVRPPELPVFTSAAPPAPLVVAPAVAVNHARSPVPAAHKTASKAAPAASAPFSIFCDEPSVAVAVAAASAPAKAVRTASSPRAAAFSIYEGGNSPLPPTVSKRSNSGKGLNSSFLSAAPAPAFSIFEDEAPLAAKAPAPAFTLYESPPKPAQQTVSQESAPAFSLYESPPKPVQKQPTMNVAAPAFDIYSDEPLSTQPAVPSKAGAFDIYVDEPSFSAAQPSSAPAPASVVSTQSSLPATTPVAAAPEATTEDQDRELHAILDSMMALDNEDGTINTRLARRDIDLMFCSPTIHRAPPVPTTRPAVLAPTTAARPAAVVSDENSFCVLPTATKGDKPFERSLFRVYSDEAEGGSDGDEDHCGGDFGSVPRHQARRGRPLEDSSAGGAGMKEAVPGVLHRAAHRPFGVQLDAPFSAVKDLSAIKESSQEFSICGMLLETPGHTGTLGFGQRAPAGTHRDRGSYTQCGNMLADISDFAHSRDSFGSEMNGFAPTTAANTSTAMGFEIFSDAPPVGTAPPSTTGKRRGLGQHSDTYTGIDADPALPLPSRRRLFTPFSTALPARAPQTAVGNQRASAGRDSQQSVKREPADAFAGTSAQRSCPSIAHSRSTHKPAVPTASFSSVPAPGESLPALQLAPGHSHLLCEAAASTHTDTAPDPDIAVQTVQTAARNQRPSQSSDVSSLLTVPTQDAADGSSHAPPDSIAPTASMVHVSAQPFHRSSTPASHGPRRIAAVTVPSRHTAAPVTLPCYSADLFYTLEAPTLQLLFNRLRHSPVLHFTHLPQEAHPPCFAFRSKPNTSTAVSLPASLSEGENRQWCVVGNIGRGTYGHAILMQEAGGKADDGEGERRVYKVDTARDSVVWEAVVHVQLQQRLNAVTSPQRAALLAAHQRYILAPTALLVYKSSAVLQMPYASWGTLVTVLTVLVKHKNAFSPQEHEWLCAYLTLQMVEALNVVHAAGILHCDIKTDNWVVSGCDERAEDNSSADDPSSGSSDINSSSAEKQDQPIVGVRVRLIDFGRALSARQYLPTSAAALDPASVRGKAGGGAQHVTSPQLRQSDEQAELFASLYPDLSRVGQLPTAGGDHGDGPCTPVRYTGDVSCKGFQCTEMQRDEPWSYQNDLHGLCGCVHQLLHLQPLACCQEPGLTLARRGLDLPHAVQLLVETAGTMDGIGADAVGGANREASRLVQSSGREQYTVPQASLKRYWCKPLWSAVYLLLLNSAALTRSALGRDITREGSGPVLAAVKRVLSEYLSTEAAQGVSKGALGKLVAALQELEV